MTVVTSTTPCISKDMSSNPPNNFCTNTSILTMVNRRNTDCIILYLEIKLLTCKKKRSLLESGFLFPARGKGTLLYKLLMMHLGMRVVAEKSMVFEPFWSEIGKSKIITILV